MAAEIEDLRLFSLIYSGFYPENGHIYWITVLGWYARLRESRTNVVKCKLWL